ncbi:MAG: DUF3108 domain-containing protein [Clostridia bacterium]
MRKTVAWMVACVILIAGLSGCTPKWSMDDYEVLDVFSAAGRFVYEKSKFGEKEGMVEYVYERTGELVSLLCTIHFEQGTYLAGTVFDKNTLIPVSSHKSNTYTGQEEKNWEIQAQFRDRITLQAVTADGTDAKEMERPERLIDNESMVIVLGALPLEDGYEKTINISMIEAGVVKPFLVTFLGREEVSVPYGTFQCIMVEVRYVGPVLGFRPRMHLWYSDDENRYLIQYENSGEMLKLAEMD